MTKSGNHGKTLRRRFTDTELHSKKVGLNESTFTANFEMIDDVFAVDSQNLEHYDLANSSEFISFDYLSTITDHSNICDDYSF